MHFCNSKHGMVNNIICLVWVWVIQKMFSPKQTKNIIGCLEKKGMSYLVPFKTYCEMALKDKYNFGQLKLCL